ncbi:transposase [Paramecium bursaria Chlorella virus AP110A]|nr:transposase [Paramecium bursaria Chlorella virus AP110A]
MLSALIRVHGKEHQQDISSIIPCVVQKKSVKKPPKENDKKSASKSLEKKPRKPRAAKKAPVQPGEEKDIEYSEFVPMEVDKNPLPASYKDVEDDDGDFMAITGLDDDDDDDDKYENIDKLYRKRDIEWANMMEEAAAVLDDAEGISDADVDGSLLSSSQVSEHDDIEGSVISELDTMDNDVADVVDDDTFFERQVAEPKIKVYKGPSLFKDMDYIP